MIVDAQDKRREPRLACEATVVNVHPDDYTQPLAARVVEVSKSGLRFLVDEALIVGSVVRIDFDGLIVEGDIRYCQPDSDNRSFAVGVRTVYVKCGKVHGEGQTKF